MLSPTTANYILRAACASTATKATTPTQVQSRLNKLRGAWVAVEQCGWQHTKIK